MIYPSFYFDKSKPIRMFEAFSGVGCQAMALKRITDKYELIGFSEIDVHAIKSYQAIHGEVKNYGDIRLMGSIPPCDIFTWSFPCTDLSKAGKQKGLSGGTRSGLVYEVLRLLRDTAKYVPFHRHIPKNSKTHSMGESTDYYQPIPNIKKLPKVLIMENVIDLVQSKFVKAFNEIQRELEELGYTNYNEVLNAKDFEIPQNRERVFMVSILKDEENEHYVYDFPIKRPLKIRLKDVLEENVDEKYYLSAKALSGVINTTFQSSKLESRTEDENGVIPTLCARNYKDPKLVQVAQLKGYESSGRIYSGDGLAPTINTMGGGQREPKISVKTWNGETKALKTKANDMPRDRIYIDESIGFAITTNESQMPHIAIKEATNAKNVMTDIASTLGTNCGSSTSAGGGVVLIPEATTKGYAEASDGDDVYLNRPHQKRGVVQKGMIQTIKTSGSDVGVVVKEKSNLKSQMCEQLIREGKAKENDVIRHSYTKSRMRGDMKDIQENNISPTLDTRADCLGVVVQQKARGYNKGGKHELCPPITSNSFQENNHLLSGLRIRKLTPFECWRLMGISDEDFYKAKNAGVSNSQLYKQAGNGIVVNVFEAILREMIR